MASAAAIFQHQLTAGRALSPMDTTGSTSGSSGTSGTSSSDSSDSDSATISANDFLTLLVTEMQNQDPTADTDPNEYINQLVQVNSLEQLIDINQTLGSALGSSSSTTGSSDPSTQVTAAGATAHPGQTSLGTNSIPGAAAVQRSTAVNPESFAVPTAAGHLMQGTNGNLSVPATSAAANRVGHALDGRVRASSTGLAGPGTQ
jgi:flagellar basal-body rod modification protein FlgD